MSCRVERLDGRPSLLLIPSLKLSLMVLARLRLAATPTGTIDTPAVVVFNTVEGIYPYKIVYHKADGKKKTSGTFAVRSCRVCG